MSEKQPLEDARSLPGGVEQLPIEQNGLENSTMDNQPLERQWLPGPIKRLPWLSIGCLIVILISNAAIITLCEWIGVDGQLESDEKHRWRLEPSVWLAVFVWIDNKAVAAIFGQATIIAWWTAAMNGRTLAQLHHSWEASRSLVAIAKKIKLFNWLCVASIAFTLFSLHGTLLQKSISAAAYYPTVDRELYATISQTFPLGASGSIVSDGGTGPNDFKVGIASAHLRDITNDYANDIPPVLKDFSGCYPTEEKKHADPAGTQCGMRFPGIGFQYDCLPGVTTYLNNKSLDAQNIFAIEIGGWSPTSLWQLSFSATFKNGTECDAPIYTLTCQMTPAVVNYPVIYDRDTEAFFLDDARYNVLGDDTNEYNYTTEGSLAGSIFVDEVNHTLVPPPEEVGLNKPGGNTTLGGFYQTFGDILSGSAQVFLTQNTTFKLNGSFTGAYLTKFDASNACGTSFRNPVQDILDELRNFMFLTAVEYPAYDNLTEQLPAIDSSITESRAYYIYNRWFLLAGLLLEGLCLFIVLTLFEGYSTLGRVFSLSPLEIGKAMQNVADAGVEGGRLFMPSNGVHGTNMPADELLGMVGEQRVQYGEVAPQKLGLALASVVKKPEDGSAYV